MIRLASLLLSTRLWLWNAGTLPTGDWLVWAGRIRRLEYGPHVAVEWDSKGLVGYAIWANRQDESDLYEAWTWYGERTLLQGGSLIPPWRHPVDIQDGARHDPS